MTGAEIGAVSGLVAVSMGLIELVKAKFGRSGLTDSQASQLRELHGRADNHGETIRILGEIAFCQRGTAEALERLHAQVVKLDERAERIEHKQLRPPA